MLGAVSLREPVVLEHTRHGLREGGTEGRGDGLLRFDGAMQVADRE